MKIKPMIMFTGRKGFTLIEMLIVIAIIGILASIVLVGLGPIQRDARDSRRASDLRSIQTLLEVCYTRGTAYPADITLPTLNLCSGARTVPVDPTGAVYFYGLDPVAGQGYILGATLENTGSNLLANDLPDGLTFGVDCTDPVYCVGI